MRIYLDRKHFVLPFTRHLSAVTRWVLAWCLKRTWLHMNISLTGCYRACVSPLTPTDQFKFAVRVTVLNRVVLLITGVHWYPCHFRLDFPVAVQLLEVYYFSFWIVRPAVFFFFFFFCLFVCLFFFFAL